MNGTKKLSMTGLSLNDLTIIFNYHKDKEQLDFVMDQWQKANPSGDLSFIICDTGPHNHTIDCDDLRKYNFKIKVLKLDKYLPFNQPLGKNLSMMECDTKWAFITDPDRFLGKDSLDILESCSLEEDVAYDFDDYHYDPETGGKASPMERHPNTFLLTKDYFNKVGGYNELFCGSYGFDDAAFREQIVIKTIPSTYIFHYHLDDDRVRDTRRNALYYMQGKERPFVSGTGSHQIIFP